MDCDIPGDRHLVTQQASRPWVEPRVYHMLGKCFNTDSPILGSREYHTCWLDIPSGRVWKELSY